jgi:hypothetical protein
MAAVDELDHKKKAAAAQAGGPTKGGGGEPLVFWNSSVSGLGQPPDLFCIPAVIVIFV